MNPVQGFFTGVFLFLKTTLFLILSLFGLGVASGCILDDIRDRVTFTQDKGDSLGDDIGDIFDNVTGLFDD